MTLPDFLVAGAAKCGTTSMHAWLQSHPGIFMPRFKEPHYFTVNNHYGLDWYEGFFANAKDGQIVGEASPGYFSHAEAPGRIAELLPGVRLVFILREPVARLISHYWFMMHGGRIPFAMPFERFLAEQRRIVDIGFYDEHIARYAALFPAEHIKIVVFEEMTGESGSAVIADVVGFLGADPDVQLKLEERHNVTAMPAPEAASGRMLNLWRTVNARTRGTLAGKVLSAVAGKARRVAAPRPMTREEREAAISMEQRARLSETYAPSVRRLEERMGRDLSDVWVPPL